MAEQFWFRQCAALIEDNIELEAFVDVRRLVGSLRNSREVGQSYWLPICLGLWLQQFIHDSARWSNPAPRRPYEAIVSASSGKGAGQ